MGGKGSGRTFGAKGKIEPIPYRSDYKDELILRVGNKRRALTSKERKKVVQLYLERGTLLAVAQETGLTVHGVRTVLDREPDFMAQYLKKREEEANELFGAISAKSAKFTKFCDAYFDELTNPEMVKRLARTDMEKLTKVFAINLDKFVLLNRMRLENGDNGDSSINITITKKRKSEATAAERDEMFVDEE